MKIKTGLPLAFDLKAEKLYFAKLRIYLLNKTVLQSAKVNRK